MAPASRVCVFVSSARQNFRNRKAIRQTWLRFARPPQEEASSTEANALSPDERARLTVRFVVSRKGKADTEDAAAKNAAAVDAALDAEHAAHGDLFFASTPEGYDRLWAKALEYLGSELLPEEEQSKEDSVAFFFHADDDSYVRLDLLMREVLFPREGGGQGSAGPPPPPPSPPRSRFYWGYVWNSPEQNPGARTTPIRDARNKSHMPESDYPFDSYPPFCSGCGFALSRDLAQALVRGAASGAVQREYRVLDPPFGVYLCGSPPPEGRGLFGRGKAEEEEGEEEAAAAGAAAAAAEAGGPVVPVHDARVRPYRALPLFDKTTIVQHYLRPEEISPYHARVLASLEGGGGEEEGEEDGGGGAAGRLHEQLVAMGLLRR